MTDLMTADNLKTDYAADDDADYDDDDPPALAGGQKNYITAAGYKHLEDELHTLHRVERPKVVQVVSWAASNGDRSENGDYIYGKKRLREIDRRIRFLTKRLKIAYIVNPAEQKNHDQIFFGATVTYSKVDDQNDHNQTTVAIVGVDEADLERGKISWVSPVAKALFKAYEGDVVNIRTPGGLVPVEIISIRYD
jgi:transcription elongation factor GreB